MAFEQDSQRFFVLQKGPLWSRYDMDVDTVEPRNSAPGVCCPVCNGPIGIRSGSPMPFVTRG